jgi:hypothetical protein
MEKPEKIILSIAIFLLSMGLVSGIYVEKKTNENETTFFADGYLEVEDFLLHMDNIFSNCTGHICITDRGNYSGVSLSCIINISNIHDPEIHDYTIIALDGYTKTVSWNDMKKGILTDKRYAVFSHLPRAYWITDVLKIEVK